MSVLPAAFLSYTHVDDEHHDGAITKLCEALSKALRVATGQDFRIFQDRKDIGWGQHWPTRLEDGLAGSRFLIPILSPSFFTSDWCRKELESFLEIERAAGRRDLILPIYFVKTAFLESPARRDQDPLAQAIAERQYRDWRELRHRPFDAYEIRRALDSLADELVQALERSGDAGPQDDIVLLDEAAQRPAGARRQSSTDRFIELAQDARHRLPRHRRPMVPGDGDHPCRHLPHGLAAGRAGAIQ